MILALAAACSDDFESTSSVTGVRVLAVQLDTPFARPGADVSLSMLAHDGAAPVDAQPSLSIAWFSGCTNPDDDSPTACHARLSWIAGLAPGDLAGETTPTLPDGAAIGRGATFRYAVPGDLVERHARRVGEPVARGLAYVFFAACAGRLVADPAARPRAGIPVRCVDPGSGAELGARRFVSGYVPIRAYEALVNANPVLGETVLDGSTPQRCSADAACDSGRCVEGRCALSVRRCDAGSRDDCPALRVTPSVTAESYELDESAASPGIAAEGELIWAAYFTTAGAFDAPVRTLFEPADGRRPASDFAGALRLNPGFTGPARVWSVVHDGRGGVAWTQTDLVVR